MQPELLHRGTCRATPKMTQQHHASLPSSMHDISQRLCTAVGTVSRNGMRHAVQRLSRRLLSFSKRNYFFAVIALVNAVGLAEVGPALWRSFE